jgi:outer membrane protein TolC
VRAVSWGALAAALVAAVPPLAAQAPAGDPFAAIVAEALAENRTVAQARLGAERAAAGVREARARFLPALTVDARRSRQSGVLDLGDAINPAYAALNAVLGEPRFPTGVSISLPFAYESRARLAQPLFDPAIAFGYAAARAAGDAGALDARAVGRRVAADAQAAWLDAASARRGRMVWESALALVAEAERVAGRLVAAGRATPDALFRARADRADVDQRLAEARDAEGAAARAFNHLVGRPLDAPVEEIADSALLFPLPSDEADAVRRALARREEIGGAEAGARAARAAVRAVGAAFLPRVAAALDYGFQGAGVTLDRRRDFAVGSLVVSWDAFNGGRDVARRQAAVADAERARVRAAETRELVILDVRQAYRAAAVARAAIGTADARVAAARSGYSLVQRRYAEGLASQVELLDARTTLTDAELNRVITAYRYARRYVELERASAARTID